MNENKIIKMERNRWISSWTAHDRFTILFKKIKIKNEMRYDTQNGRRRIWDIVVAFINSTLLDCYTFIY